MWLEYINFNARLINKKKRVFHVTCDLVERQYSPLNAIKQLFGQDHSFRSVVTRKCNLVGTIGELYHIEHGRPFCDPEGVATREIYKAFPEMKPYAKYLKGVTRNVN